MTFTKGQRVKTKFGPATVVGFETFNARGFSNPLADVDPEDGCRVVVQLDNPKEWISTMQTPHPYMFRREIKPL